MTRKRRKKPAKKPTPKKRGPGQPRSFESPEELDKRAVAYFDWCDAKTKEFYNEKVGVVTCNIPEPYTILGLCLHMGINRDTLHTYGKKKEYSDVVTRIRARCEQDTTLRLFDQKQCNGAKFLLAAKYGYSERHDITSGGEKLNPGIVVLPSDEKSPKG